ncbi:hypothetical protein [Aquimarina algiphila]|uniref:hypothetical protein n=1 Tax=Aquimarina algiphila TaxID=2047982 RepID=UPI00232B58D8|nr:hypothetical protein [Aquimarina algiphila]
MELKFYKKAIEVIRKTDSDTEIRTCGSMLYLREAKPKVIQALLDADFGLALSDGEAQVLQKLDPTRDVTKY